VKVVLVPSTYIIEGAMYGTVRYLMYRFGCGS